VNRTQKQENITALQEGLAEAASVVVLHYRGLTVAEVTSLRKKARENGVTIKVAKNRLAKRAIDGSKFSKIADYLKGPTAIAYSKDEVAAAKAVVNFAKDNEKVVIIGGALNENALDEAGVQSLAALPSLDESRAKLLALINTPATRIVGILQAPGGQVARVISAKASKGE
jgi:large subunit ribosomal protein L10